MSDTPGVLRVGIDVSAVPPRPAGAARYTIELVRALLGGGGAAPVLFCRRDDADRWARLAPGAAPAVVPAAPRSRPVRLLWEELALGRVLGGRGLSVFHGPHYNLPRSSPVPLVATVHDLIFFSHPEWHTHARVAVFRRATARAARHAEVVICVSERTAAAFSERFSPRGEVRVVPHGLDHAAFSAAEPAPGADAATLARLGVRPPYVCFVGTIEPRKNVPVLIEAFDALATRRGDLSLVIAGQRAWGGDELDAALRRAAHRGRITVLGYLGGGDVPALLRGAAVAAYPSSEEGFGLPALEALACGTPLVTSEDTVMADVAGEAALLVPAGDAAALAEALEAALEGADPTRRERGIALAAAYTWERTAAEHLDAYRAAAHR